MTHGYNVDYRICATRQCKNRVSIKDKKNPNGPVFCSEECEYFYTIDHPYWAPTLSGDEITDELNEYNLGAL